MKKYILFGALMAEIIIFIILTIMGIKGTLTWGNKSKDGWIPTKERLPKENGKYLCTYEFMGEKCRGIYNFANDLYEVHKFDFSKYQGKNKKAGFYYYSCFTYGCLEANSITAWMPLPEPYGKDNDYTVEELSTNQVMWKTIWTNERWTTESEGEHD